jgi:branched-chain amino acid aminotransferase
MAQREALRNGYDTAIFLNKEGLLSEGPGSCLFLVKDGILITPKTTDSILESITRDSIIKIAENLLNIKVVQRSVDRTELYMCDEAFLCGSAMEITPIFSIDKFVINNSICGNITKNLHFKYLEIATGKDDFYLNWNTIIY